MPVHRTELGVLKYSSSLLDHDDGYHEGSAKRGGADGVAPLDASAEVLHVNSFRPVPDLSTAKTIDMIYQAGSRPILVTVAFRGQSGASAGYAALNGFVGATTPPTVLRAQSGMYQMPANLTMFFVLTLMIPANYYYKATTFTTTTGVIDQVKWHEIEL